MFSGCLGHLWKVYFQHKGKRTPPHATPSSPSLHKYSVYKYLWSIFQVAGVRNARIRMQSYSDTAILRDALFQTGEVNVQTCRRQVGSPGARGWVRLHRK